MTEEVNPCKVYLRGGFSVFRDQNGIHRTKELKRFIGDRGMRCHYEIEEEEISYTDQTRQDEFFDQIGRQRRKVYRPYLLFWYPDEAMIFKLSWRNG